MTIKLTYTIPQGFETLSYEVPESVVRFTEYTLKLKGVTDREVINKTFLSYDDIQLTIKGYTVRKAVVQKPNSKTKTAVLEY